MAGLQAAQQQLKAYRQAVLKDAFEGKLTAAWREQRQRQTSEVSETSEVFDAHALLKKIKEERERRYQEQLAEWKRACQEAERVGGKKQGKSRHPLEISDLTNQELSNLPPLPNGWIWTKMGNITLGVEYGTSAKSQKEGDVPVLRMGNIQNCIFDWSDLVYSNDQTEIEKYLLSPGDVLFNRTNSPELVGKTAIYQGERKAIFAGYLIRINHIPNLIIGKYLNYFLNSKIAKDYGNSAKTDGVNQSNINGEKLKNYPLPYTSISEQKKVVEEIESRLSIADKLEETIKQSLQQAEALRQSILKRAFAGKLVAQDPNDEPAEKLLERIKVARNQ